MADDEFSMLVAQEAERYAYSLPPPAYPMHPCAGLVTAPSWFEGVDVPKVEVKNGVLVRLFIQALNGLLMDAGLEPSERARVLNLDPRSEEMQRALQIAEEAAPDSSYLKVAVTEVATVAKALGPLEPSDE